MLSIQQQTQHGALENNQDRAARPDEEETAHVTPPNNTAGPAGGRTPGSHQPVGGKAENGAAGEGTVENGAAGEGTVENGTAEEGTVGKSTAQPAPGTSGILPTKAAEDDPRRWGDAPDDDHDAWLREQKPPHWG